MVVCTAHTTQQNFLIGSIPKIEFFQLVEMMSSISQSLYDFSQPDFHHTCPSRILSRESKSFVSCSHMNCCLQKYTTHQFTYFIYYSYQDKLKNSRLIKIHQVHQELHTKQF